MARSSLIPGFRFHPTDVELVMFYLKRKLLGKKITVKAVAEVNIYDFSPWDLPDKSALKSGDLEYYFFCPKAKKYSSGCRSKRSTEIGFWKATGKDRQVSYKGETVATIKTLVFHIGHTGKGQRTDWVMHEYKMEDAYLANAGIVQDMYVLCKVFEKSGSGPKNGAHYGAPFNEEEWGDELVTNIDSNAVAGLLGGSDTTVNHQNGLTTMSMTEPGPSIVTVTADRSTNTVNECGGELAGCIKSQVVVGLAGASNMNDNGLTTTNIGEPCATNITEPGSSIVMFSANRSTNITEPGSSIVMFSANQSTNITEPDSSIVTFSANRSTNITEPGSSIVMFSANRSTNIMNETQKGPATNDDVMFLEDIDELFNDEDLMFIEDVDAIMGSEEIEAVNVEKVMTSKDDGTFDGLVNLMDLDDLNEIDFKTNMDSYTLDKLLSLDDLDSNLEEFNVE